MSTLRKTRLLVFFVPLLFSLPYIHRALFVDDQFFVRIAMWLKDHPMDPYGFAIEDALPGHNITQDEILTSIVNPLIHPYILAGLIRLGGEREWFWRLGCLMFSCFSGLIIFELARRWTSQPFLSTCLVLMTPVYAVSAHSMLIDPTMNFFFLAAMFCFILSLERMEWKWAGVGGVAFGLALITKYTAVLLAPVAVAIWLLMGRRRQQLGYLVVLLGTGLVFLLMYLGMTKILYGKSHLAASAPVTLQNLSWEKTFVLFLFMTGGLVLPLLSWIFLNRRDTLMALLILVLCLFWLRQPPQKFAWDMAILMAVWFASFLVLCVVFIQSLKTFDRASDRLLLSWMICFLVMMVAVMPWVAVRYLMLGTVPSIFLIVRLIDRKYPSKIGLFMKTSVTVLFLISTAIAYADFQQAQAGRRLAQDALSRSWMGSQGNYFVAESFTMTDLSRNGWRRSPASNELKVGDRIVVSEITFPLSWFIRKNIPVRWLDTLEYSSHFPIKVMDSKSGASFYASAWGPLPYAFSTGPWERFHLFEVIESVGK